MYGPKTQNDAHPQDLDPEIHSIQVRGAAVSSFFYLIPRTDIDCVAWVAHDGKRSRDRPHVMSEV